MKRQKDDAYFISRIIDDIDYTLVDFAFLGFSYFCETSQRAMSIISIP